jgi:hypothetical protein
LALAIVSGVTAVVTWTMATPATANTKKNYLAHFLVLHRQPILQPTIDIQDYRWLPRKSQIVALSENELDERGVPPPHRNLLAPKFHGSQILPAVV